MKRLSIKIRVTLWYTLLVTAIAGIALAVVFAGGQRMVINYYRESLLSTAQLAQDDIQYDGGRLEIDRNLDDLPNVRVAIYTLEGELIYGQQRFDLPFEEDIYREATGRTGEHWYVRDERMDLDEGNSIWLRLFISMDTMENLNHRSTVLIYFTFPALVLLAAVGGYLIARRAFRPVAQIARTAEGIADGSDLKKRIDLTGARDELYQLARVFDDMLERLQRSFDRERRFTSDVSHELRTPVAGILAQSEFAISEVASDDDRISALSDIHRRASDMSELIGKLLTLTRMDAGQTPLQPEPLELRMMLEIAAMQMADAAAAQGMEIVLEDGREITVCCDQTMMMQAVLNLISNAIRYGQPPSGGGVIRLLAAVDSGWARLSVRDEGPGIAEADLPHVFERFYQADASRHREGYGLGLALVRQIAELHGGRVTVESRQGEGCCFSIWLPMEGDGQ